MSAKYKRLSPEQWNEFKCEMQKQGIPFDREKRNVAQQLWWSLTMRIIEAHGSVRAFNVLHERLDQRLKEHEAQRSKIYVDWTESYGRSRQIGDKVLFVDFAGVSSICWDDPMIFDCIQEHHS